MPGRLRISEQQEVSCIEREVREHRHFDALRPVIDDAIANTGHRSEHDVAGASGEMSQAKQQAAHGNRHATSVPHSLQARGELTLDKAAEESFLAEADEEEIDGRPDPEYRRPLWLPREVAQRTRAHRYHHHVDDHD